MKKIDILKNVYNDISYEINGIWDNSIEEDSERVEQLSKILDKCDEELKNDLIDIIQVYCYRLYEDLDLLDLLNSELKEDEIPF
jgi:predicted site-specific integrase-resolvase